MSFTLLQPNDNTIETGTPGNIRSTNAYSQALQVTVVETRNAALVVSFMECFFSAVNATNPTIELGIYTWDGAGGGTLLSSGTVVPTAPGWAKVTLASPVKLAARTRYYFAYLNRISGDGTTTLGNQGSSVVSVLLSGVANSVTAMPSTLPTLTSTAAVALMLRAWS